jgi:hypothetical protein
MPRGRPLRDVHRSVAIHPGDDDGQLAPMNHRLELVGVAPPHATSMEFDCVSLCAGPARDLGFMALETPDDGDVHGLPFPDLT